MARRGFTDSQRARLYKAEREAFKGGEFANRLTEDEARELVAKVWAQSGTLDRVPDVRVSSRLRVGTAWYFPTPHEILFSSRIVRWIVIHELTHAIEDRGAGHGPEFVRAYLRLVERTFGFEARERLGAAFRKYKVRSTGRSREKVRGTGPKRETKREKAEKMAAAVGMRFERDGGSHWYDVYEGDGRCDAGLYGLDSVIRYFERKAA